MMDNEKIDKITLKQQRKARKLLKKEAKRKERQKEKEKKFFDIKFGSKDHSVKIISNDTSNINKTCSQFEKLNTSFPSLEEASHIKSKSLAKNYSVAQSQTNIEKLSVTKRKKSSPITLNITDILSAPLISKVETNLEKKKNVIPLHGNILDASQPIRLRGKHRENPKRKQLSKLKTQIISDSKICDAMRTDYGSVHSPNFETYCDHIITEDLNLLAKNFLTDIVRFQELLYKHDTIKGNAKRRYIVGLREVKKFMIIKKIKFIIIAPNIKTIVENGALDTAVQDLISLAKTNKIPYMFALSRWKIGEITLKFRPISCVGIFDYSGGENKYYEILKLLTTAKILYMNSLQIPTNETTLNGDNKTQEIVQKCIDVCTS